VSVDNSPTDRADAADRGTVLPLLVLELVDHGEYALALFALELVGRLSAERGVGVGEVPAEPVVLDRDGDALPAITIGSPGGRCPSGAWR
jgi:hypothetical protein